MNRLVARGYLERMGCSVSEAATGGEALAVAQGGTFDAILVDLDLPDMRGEDVAARIDRKAARLAILTADLVRDDAASRARYGADHVLTKPISPRALVMLLAGAAGGEAGTQEAGPESVLREDVANLGTELAAEIVQAFLADLGRAIPELLGTPDDEERRRTAHRLKGAASNFALHDLCDRLRRLQAGDSGALEGLELAARAAEQGLRAAAGRAGLQLPEGDAKQ